MQKDCDDCGTIDIPLINRGNRLLCSMCYEIPEFIPSHIPDSGCQCGRCNECFLQPDKPIEKAKEVRLPRLPKFSEIEKASSVSARAFFSWVDVPKEEEMDCYHEGFLSGVTWLMNKLKEEHGKEK